MNTIIKIVRSFALSVAVAATLIGGSVSTRAEGNGVGGSIRPPIMVVVNPDYAQYDNGTRVNRSFVTFDYVQYEDNSRVYRDGTIVYADGRVGHL